MGLFHSLLQAGLSRRFRWTRRCLEENPVRRFGAASDGSCAGSAQFRQNLVRDFEKCAAKRYRQFRAGDAPASSWPAKHRMNQGLEYNPNRPEVCVDARVKNSLTLLSCLLQFSVQEFYFHRERWLKFQEPRGDVHGSMNQREYVNVACLLITNKNILFAPVELEPGMKLWLIA